MSAETLAELTGDDGRRDADRFAWADEMSMHLARLPDAQKHVIVMAYYGQQSQTEIAAALRIPLGTVKTRTARGLHRLSELLAEANRPAHPSVVGTNDPGPVFAGAFASIPRTSADVPVSADVT